MSNPVRMSFLAFTLSVCALAGQTHAEEPHGVVRTFAVLSLQPVDFTDEESVLVAAARTDFSPRNCEVYQPGHPDFDGTRWVNGRATHITEGDGVTSIGVLWILSEDTPEPPPVGTVAITGPEAPLIQESLGNVRIFSGPTNFIVPGDSGDLTMIVVTAAFNR